MAHKVSSLAATFALALLTAPVSSQAQDGNTGIYAAAQGVTKAFSSAALAACMASYDALYKPNPSMTPFGQGQRVEADGIDCARYEINAILAGETGDVRGASRCEFSLPGTLTPGLQFREIVGGTQHGAVIEANVNIPHDLRFIVPRGLLFFTFGAVDIGLDGEAYNQPTLSYAGAHLPSLDGGRALINLIDVLNEARKACLRGPTS